MKMRALLGSLLIIGGFAAPPALATDGVLEINQACAAVGCLPGDSPGFPVQIFDEGSYRLTSNLSVPVGVSGGVYIGSKASLDLNGFVIRGPGTCLGSAGGVSCVGLSGYGVAIETGSTASVRNGIITGTRQGLDVVSSSSAALSDLLIHQAETGVFGRSAATSVSMEDVRVEQTSGSCMFFTAAVVTNRLVTIRSSVVKNCHDSGIALDPGFRLSVAETELVDIGILGILAGEGASIRNVRVNAVGSDGLSCGRFCNVEGSRFLGNGGRGIVAGESSSITENEVGQNSATAVVAGDGSTISRNTVYASDGVTGTSNGIECPNGCGVFENVIRFSTVPISLGGDSRSGRNVMSFYQNPPGLGVSAGDNLCSGTDC